MNFGNAKTVGQARPGVLEGRWKIDYAKPLGEGGFSEVFECEDLRLSAEPGGAAVRYAAHVLRPGAPQEVRERVRSSAVVVEQSDDPCLIRTHAFSDPEAEIAWYITDVCRFPTVDRWVTKATALEANSVLRIGHEIASCLARLLEKAYAGATRELAIHRDLAPSNIHVVCEQLPDGNFGPVRGVKINDLTFAPKPGRMQKSAFELGGLLFGTPGFRAPEILQRRPPTVRSDVFSLGALLAYAATGAVPDDGCAPLKSDLAASALPRRAARFILRMTAAEPADRPTSYAEVAEKLGAILRELELPRWRQILYQGTFAAAFALVLAILTLGGIEVWKKARTPASPSDSGAGRISENPDRSSVEEGDPPPAAAPDDGKKNTHLEPKEDPTWGPAAAGMKELAKDPPAPAVALAFIIPGSAEAAGAGAMKTLLLRHRGELAALDFAPAAEEAEAAGLGELAKSLRAGGAKIEGALAAWRAGKTLPVVRTERVQLASINDAGRAQLTGLTTDGVEMTVPLDAVDVGPIFAGLEPADYIRAVWASRGPATAANCAIATGLPPEGWWIIDAALSDSEENLSGVARAVDAVLAQPGKPYAPPALPPMPGYDPKPKEEPARLDVSIGSNEVVLKQTGEVARELAGAPWWAEVAALDGTLETRRAKIVTEVGAWELFLLRKDDDVAERYAATAAFARSVERACRERASLAWNILGRDEIAIRPYRRGDSVPAQVKRGPAGQGDRIEPDERGTPFEVGPQDYQRKRRVGYLQVRATLKRAGSKPGLWFKLSPGQDGSRLEIAGSESGKTTVGLSDEKSVRAEAPDLFDPSKVIEHRIELVAIGSVAALRIDGKIAYVTTWVQDPSYWPWVGFSDVAGGEISEILEWSVFEK